MKLTKLMAAAAVGAMALATTAQAEGIQDAAAELNATLAAQGADYELAYMEYIVVDSADEAGRTVFFKDVGNKQLTSHFVPGDSRRAWSGADPSTIDWVYETVDKTGDVSDADQKTAIYNAMATWEDQKCSTIGLNGADVNTDIGLVQYIISGGAYGSPFIYGDLTHAGFLPGVYFDAIAPGGSGFILGVTFTYVFNGGDSNNDGYSDTAFREIYYNDAFPWQTNGGSIDIETVAFHEVGHGLSQGHFGTAFRDAGSGKLHFSPLAVMNAGYSQVQRAPRGSDKGGHCSIWASWPN